MLLQIAIKRSNLLNFVSNQQIQPVLNKNVGFKYLCKPNSLKLFNFLNNMYLHKKINNLSTSEIFNFLLITNSLAIPNKGDNPINLIFYCSP